MKRGEILPLEQYLDALEKLSKNRPAEDESDASDLDGEVAEYRDLETNSEIDVEDNRVHKEDNDSNSDRNVFIIHPLSL
ncbi:hypothetical protein AVEN_72920-1 [Araneus ventricosus]|uniref:Uncharacterized protein n=1 Tax=Araneus ventricosus TaxID=182803 RepID=A0A4Y2GW21_ARAVE|nr:hypothetical protein AVEN_72920-1 [Araneus ventricosus]